MAKDFSVSPITGALGAEISGLNLARDVDESTWPRLLDLFHEHLVLFFPDQALTPGDLRGFASRFGQPQVHPYVKCIEGHPEVIEIVKEPEERRNWGDGWHTDQTALPEPPLGAALYCLEAPPFSGDTMFSNMYLAYETLSDGMKRLIGKMRCVHRMDSSFYEGFDKIPFNDAAAIESEHPLVRTHPGTGRKSLFLHRNFISHIKGLTPAESRPILDFLYDHAEQPDFACRFRWTPGTLAVWDNRCTQHRVSADYFYEQRNFAGGRRRMHRVAIVGDRPV